MPFSLRYVVPSHYCFFFISAIWYLFQEKLSLMPKALNFYDCRTLNFSFTMLNFPTPLRVTFHLPLHTQMYTMLHFASPSFKTPCLPNLTKWYSVEYETLTPSIPKTSQWPISASYNNSNPHIADHAKICQWTNLESKDHISAPQTDHSNMKLQFVMPEKFLSSFIK